MNNGTVNFLLNLALSGDNSDGGQSELGVTKTQVNIARGLSFAHGSGSGQSNVIWHDKLAVTTADTLDLNGVVFGLQDVFGTALVLTKLKALYIKNLTGGNLTIGGAGAAALEIFGTPATDTLVLINNGQFMYIAPEDGLAIDDTKDELKFVHAEGGAQNVEIVIVGVR